MCSALSNIRSSFLDYRQQMIFFCFLFLGLSQLCLVGSSSTGPETLLIEDGKALNLTCSEESDQISWFKNGRTLHITSNVRIQNHRVQIVSPTMDDTGDYECKKSGRSLHNISVAELSFEDLPPTTTVQLNETLSLKCQVEGHPRPIVQWLKDGDLIVNSTRRRLVKINYIENARLNIDQAQMSDAGNYTCTVDVRSLRKNTSTKVGVLTGGGSVSALDFAVVLVAVLSYSFASPLP